MRAPRLAAWLGTRRRRLASLGLLPLGALVFVLAGGPARLAGRDPQRCSWARGSGITPILEWDIGHDVLCGIDSFQDPRDVFLLGIPIAMIQLTTSPSFGWANLDDGHLYPGDTLVSARLWGTRPVTGADGRGHGLPQATGWTFVVVDRDGPSTYHITIACTPVGGGPAPGAY